MEQQRVLLESSAAYTLVCLVLAIAFGFVLYRGQHPWSKTWNYILFGVRSVLAFFLMFLLLGPIVRQINNLFEKPIFVLLIDNSASVRETTDSTMLQNTLVKIKETAEQLSEKGFETKVLTLTGNASPAIDFNATSSDLSGTIQQLTNRFEGQKIDGIVLVSDGIYNSGISPLYKNYKFPIYTIGVGDTVQRVDAALKNVAYNKIAYQGNRFPLRAEVMVKNMPNEPVTVSLYQRGKLLEQQTKKSTGDQLLSFDFQPLASEQGIQKFDIVVEAKIIESNTRNNRASVFIEVVEGKKKIVLIAAAPHPDIKALREVAEKNSNYEFLIHIPGVHELPAADLQPAKIDLALFHQAPDMRGKTSELFQQFVSSNTTLLLILGQQSNIPLLTTLKMPLTFESNVRDFDDVTPTVNSSFSGFNLSPETITSMARYPPVAVHFGRMKTAPTATHLLYQQIGSIDTEKPLLTIDIQEKKKIAILLGEGIWRWKLNEFDRTEKTVAFDEIFGKLFQYLSTSDDKRKFRSYPTQQEFSDSEPVTFESQVYNDIFEPIYGQVIDITVTSEQGQKNTYTYTTSAGNTRYQIGGLKEGVYRYTSKTLVNQKPEEVKGEFAVVEQQIELQNLTADFNLLRKLSEQSGASFYQTSQLDALQTQLQKTEARSTIHTEESFQSLIHLKWIFFLLILMISTEWFVRKYFGSY